MSEHELSKRLRIKAFMIEMGERIAWGSDSELMREAANLIDQLAAKPVPDVHSEIAAALSLFPANLVAQTFLVGGYQGPLEADDDTQFFSRKKVLALLDKIHGYLTAAATLTAAPSAPQPVQARTVGELPPLPNAFALSISVHTGEHCKWPLLECQLLQEHPAEKQKLYTSDQVRAYAQAAIAQAGQSAWCNCPPKECHGESINTCRWHQMGYSPNAQAGQSQWQPIETAPKDCSPVILGYALDEEYGGFVAQGRWHEEDHDGPDNIGHDAGFMDDQFDFFKCGRSFGNPKYMTKGTQPTHWMPLPPPPAMLAAAQGGGV